MSQGSKALHDNIPDTSMAVEPPAMNTTTNPSNNFSPSPHQPLTDTQPARVNMPAGLNTPQPQSSHLEYSVIPYTENQPADPDLWDGVFSPISLFGVEKFLSSDVQNITCLLLRVGTFIQQCHLGNKPASDYPELTEIGAALWQLINVVYESKWDRLPMDENNYSF